jgi:hypothetical protein
MEVFMFGSLPLNFKFTWSLTMKESLLVFGIATAIAGGGFFFTESAQAMALEQYASNVIGFSSQWSSPNWSATQALGAPDTLSYGDIPTAWASLSKNGTKEFITLGFSTLIYANGATIRETYGNGFVSQIDALDTNNMLHTVWNGTDSSQPGSPVDFFASWTTTSFLAKGLKIYVDTDHNLSAWEEIDSVKLHGETPPTPVPTPALLPGLIGVSVAALRRRVQAENGVAKI